MVAPETDPIQEGTAHHWAGRLQDAEACYRRVLARDPENADANHLMGLVAKHAGKPDAAVAFMERALKRNPDFPEAHYNLGNTHWQRGDLEAAVASYDRALAFNAEHEDAWVNKGRSLQQLGRREAAIEAFRAALRVNPDSGKAWENLGLTGTFAAGDPEVEAMRAALERADPRGEDAKSLHFALGRARHDQGHVDAAFAHFAAGNAVVRSQSTYDVASEENVFAHIQRQFPRAVIDRLGGGGRGEAKPVFVVGMPRSGTTLIEQILASHPRVAAGGERHDLTNVVGNARVHAAGEAGFPGWMPQVGHEGLGQLADAYLNRLPALADGEDRVTDKMPANFRFLGLIHLMLPNAAIVHVHRSPADTCVSCYTHNFTRGHDWSFDQGSLGRYYRAYSGLMSHWRAVLPKGAFLDVRYEDVVADPEGQVARLLDHCGLEWDDRCLRFHETERPVQTASMEQVRQPLYAKSVGRWRTYAPYLGPLFTALGDLAPSTGSG